MKLKISILFLAILGLATAVPVPSQPVKRDSSEKYEYQMVVLPVPEVAPAPKDPTTPRRILQEFPEWEVVGVVAATATVKKVKDEEGKPATREVLIYTLRKLSPKR